MSDRFSTLVYSHLYSKVFLELFHHCLELTGIRHFRELFNLVSVFSHKTKIIKKKIQKSQNLIKSDQKSDQI